MLLLMATYLRVRRSAGSLDSSMLQEGSGDARARLCILDEGESAVGVGVSMMLWSGMRGVNTRDCFWDTGDFLGAQGFCTLKIQKSVCCVVCVHYLGLFAGV